MIGERCLALPYLDVIQNAPVSRLIDYRPDHDPWFFRITNAQTRCGGNQALHHAIVIFLKKNQTRQRRALLSLVTERGIYGIANCFTDIGVGVYDHRIFAAHLANDPLKLALTGSSDPSRLPNF